jgi:glutamate-5-semialdehyde dehydrogenase
MGAPMTDQTAEMTGLRPEDHADTGGESPRAGERLARAGRAAQAHLARMTTQQKGAALIAAADAIREDEALILAANAIDMAAGAARGLTGALLDRLKLDPKRLAGMADAVAAGRRPARPCGSGD